jgi:tetratricopeptide (TPR) repeat protein
VNPRPYKEPIRINFGKLMPKDKADKADKKGAKKKAPPKKAGKDEKPPKPIKWAADKGPTPATTLDLIRSAVIDINESVFPKNIRQDHQNSGIMPTLIKEVFMPPNAPSEVATLIESSLVYQNSANYEMAVKSLEMARNLWKEYERKAQNKLSDAAAVFMLRPEQELYFELSLGSIYESCGKDDIAMSCYMKARAIKLPADHPD